MNITTQTTDEHIGTSTAFRLPTSLLQTVDHWCEEHDVTRSQFFRHCIAERVKSLGIGGAQQQPQAQEEARQWLPQLCHRSQRAR
jgi:hypothetical protein